jgi:protein phosphatase
LCAFELLKACSIADANEFYNLIKRTSLTIANERTNGKSAFTDIYGDLTEITDFSNIVVIGDIHGDSSSLLTILDAIEYKTFLADPRNKMIFLGDYVDRGSDSLGVLYIVCSLKLSFPNSIILMRGNHESPKQFPFVAHDLPEKIVERFGEHSAKGVYSATLDLFDTLTLLVVVRQYLLIVHGGLPVGIAEGNRDRIKSASSSTSLNSVMEEILWNDPRNLGTVEWEKSRRGFGKHFGKSVTLRWLELTGTRAIVRGHEPCKGFKLDHDDKIITLFSSKGPYPNFDAAFLQVSNTALAKCTDAKALSEFVQLLKA